MWLPVHLKGPMIPDPSGQLAELIVYITSTRVDLYSHQIPFDTTGKWLQFVYCLPSFLCVILFSLGQNPAKMRNISRPWPNLSRSKGSQDTSACQISGHSCHAFSIKYGNHTFEMFHWVKLPPKWVKSTTDRDQNLTRWVDGTPTSEVTPVLIW